MQKAKNYIKVKIIFWGISPIEDDYTDFGLFE